MSLKLRPQGTRGWDVRSFQRDIFPFYTHFANRLVLPSAWLTVHSILGSRRCHDHVRGRVDGLPGRELGLVEQACRTNRLCIPRTGRTRRRVEKKDEMKQTKRKGSNLRIRLLFEWKKEEVSQSDVCVSVNFVMAGRLVPGSDENLRNPAAAFLTSA